MHVLAKRQGVTVGALYRYFESKQLLIAELELQCLNEICSTLEGVYAEQAQGECSTQDGLLRLWEIVSAYRVLLQGSPEYARLISGILAAPNPVVAEPFRVEAVKQMFKVLDVPARIIEQLTIDGVLTNGNSRQRALTLWLTVQGIIQLEKMEPISNGLIRVDDLLRESLTDAYLGWANQAKHELHSVWELE